MKYENNIKFIPFTEKDIPELIPIMKRAFDEDTRIHLGREAGGPPGYDNGEFLRRWGLHEHSTPFKISLDDKVIGAIILWINNENHHNALGTIFLDIDIQERGLGLEIWRKVEEMYPDTIAWHTETPIFSHRNHNFYVNKCGFHVVRIEKPKDLEEGSFILEKVISKNL